MAGFSLHGLRMNAVQTALTGVVNRDTVFAFTQDGAHVTATYAGGRVVRGYLVGLVNGARLTFRYCQLETGEVLNGGSSDCELVLGPGGERRIIERFRWETRPGHGENILQELPPAGG